MAARESGGSACLSSGWLRRARFCGTCLDRMPPNRERRRPIVKATSNPHTPLSTGTIPLRAMRDATLTADEFRFLIGVGSRADTAGWCAADLQDLCDQIGLSPEVARICAERLEAAKYIAIRPGRRRMAIRVISDQQYAHRYANAAAAVRAPPPIGATGPEARPWTSGRRTGQAKLRGDLLRRPSTIPQRLPGAAAGSQPGGGAPEAGSEIDSLDSAMAALFEISAADTGEDGGGAGGPDAPGTVDGFQFWVRTILSPEDMVVFSRWAKAQADDYQDLLTRFNDATDDGGIEALLERTLAAVSRAKEAAE